MKSKNSILSLIRGILLLFFCTTGMLYTVHAQTVYFVAPFGTDKNNGTEKFPFKSINTAQNKAREQKGEVIIYLRGGEYRLDKTLVFTPQDGNKDKHLTLSSYPGEQAVISGGVQLKLQWQRYKNGIMKAKVTPTISIDMLSLNSEISHMARYPNFDSTAIRFNGTSADATSRDRVMSWKNLSGGFLHA